MSRALCLVLMVACGAAQRTEPAPPAPAPPPPVDSDQDRIADIEDKCPSEPEIYNGTEDDDGCPDRGCVLIKQYPMCIDEPLYFAQDQTATMIEQAPIIELVVEALKTLPDIQVVTLRGERVAGEAVELSLQRAEAVRDLLVARGVAGIRLAVEDGGLGGQRVTLEITQQRVAFEELDAITCTPMGRVFITYSEDEKQRRCLEQRAQP